MRNAILIILIAVINTLIACSDIRDFKTANSSASLSERSKGKHDKKDRSSTASPGIRILEKWELPVKLKEVSGIAYLDEQRFVCIQDEEGIIFIYNISTKNIEKEIPFAGPGDYEGITLNGSTAYLVRADGLIYEVGLNADESTVKQYKTHLTIAHNIEGLCFDKQNNRLLLSIKDGEPGNPGYKGIYSFDLGKKSMATEPVYRIHLTDPVLDEAGGKKNKIVMPSSIGIHPVTHDYYITDGPKALLLTMDSSGKLKKLYSLGKEFTQPEGITFSPDGDVFISNEGVKGSGNIVKISLEE